MTDIMLSIINYCRIRTGKKHG